MSSNSTYNQQTLMNDQLERVAKTQLGFSTLKTRNSDSLDFRTVSVWDVKAALQAAYELGKGTK